MPSRLAAALIVAACIVGVANGQEPGPDFDPLGLIEETQVRRAAIASGDFAYRFSIVGDQRLVDYGDRQLEWARNTGITYLFFYAAAEQYGSQGGSQNSTGNGNANVLFAWTPRGQKSGSAGAFIFHYLSVDSYGRTDGVEFAQSLGLSSFTNDSFVDLSSFQAIAWRQQLADGLVDLRIGQLIPTTLFNALPYANDNRAFMSSPLSTEASRRIPGAGIGALVIAELWSDVFVGGSVVDANGQGDFLDFDAFFKGDYMSSIYTAYRPEFECLRRANYQFAMHFIDSTESSGYSRLLGINIDQPIGTATSAFFKYNRIDGERRLLEQSAAVGLVWTSAFGWEADWLGVGLGWSDPDDASLRDEYVIESFWRMQLTPTIQFSTDVQLWLDPSTTPGDDVQGVFTPRLLVEF